MEEEHLAPEVDFTSLRRDIDRLIDHSAHEDREERKLPTAGGNIKEVLLRTPVMIGVARLTDQLNTTRVRYVRGGFLNDQSVPPLSPFLRNAMAIRMPVEDIDTYYEEHLRPWLPLRSDEQLIEELHRHLQGKLVPDDITHKRTLRFVDIVASPLFQTFDWETQEKIKYKLEELKEHRTYHAGLQEPDL